MKKSMKLRTQEAIHVYEDKARDDWIFDWPAQPALTATRVYWTTEVCESWLIT